MCGHHLNREIIVADIKIVLVENSWTFREADHLDDGGFASVFRGMGECGPVAIKRWSVY